MNTHVNTTLVTGGASGIGAAIVRLHAARGDNATITDWSSADEARALVAELGDRVLALHSDVTDEVQVDKAFEQAPSRGGPSDAAPVGAL